MHRCLLQGYPPGFPVLIPTRASQQRSALAMQYLFDGNYLDKKSRGFTAELLTYNADLRVLGYVKMTFDWQADGAITGRHPLTFLRITGSQCSPSAVKQTNLNQYQL